MASAWVSASCGSGSSGSTSARTQRGASPEATKTRVVEREQAGFDPDATRTKQLAELEDPLLALVGRHEVGELRPGVDKGDSPLGIGFDGRRGAQRDGDAGTSGADRAQRRGARLRRKRFEAVPVVRMQV